MHCGGGKFNSQLKKAYNSGASAAVIIDAVEGDGLSARLRRLDDAGDTFELDEAGLLVALRRLATPDASA